MATKAEIIAGERLRIAAILESPEGLSRPASARKFALFSEMSAEMAVDFLKGLPVESAFAAAMDKEGPLGIDAAKGGPVSRDPKAQRLAEIKQAATQHNLSRGFISREEAKERGLALKGA